MDAQMQLRRSIGKRNRVMGMAMVVAASLLGLGANARAQFEPGATSGVPNPSGTVTFSPSELPSGMTLSQGDVVQNQFIARGVYFTSGLWINPPGSPNGAIYNPVNDPPYPNQDSARVGNFRAGVSAAQDLSIHFVAPVTDALFASVTLTAPTTLSAWKAGVLVASGEAPTNLTRSNNFIGFRNISGGFDEIRINVPNADRSTLIDNISFKYLTSAIQLNSVSTSACSTTNTLTVNVDAVGYAAATIAGGQFFLHYDVSRLTLVSVDPGPDLSILYQAAPAVGQLDLAVRTGDNGPLVGSQTLATLTFAVSGPDACDLASLVGFRASHNPPTRLSGINAQDLGGSTVDLGSVTLDHTAPIFPALPPVTGDNDANLCSRSVSLSVTTTDTCSGALAATAKIGTTPIAFPHSFNVGTTTITWTSTDACGNSASAFQYVVITDSQPPSLTPPSDITQNADAGSCTLTLSASQLGSPLVSDNCPGVGTPIASLALNGPAISFPFTFPTGTTTVFWRVTDAHANTTQATQSVTVNPFNTVVASVEEGGLGGYSTRGVTFEFFTPTACPTAFFTTCQDIEFTGNSGSVTFSVPCGMAWTGVTATDLRHTLRRSTSLAVFGTTYSVAFTSAAGKALEQGNVNNDSFIDILDFGGYIGSLGSAVGVNSFCGASGLHPDFSGNGTVGTEDFTFIQAGFLHACDLDPCGGSLRAGGPVTDISVVDLIARGMRSATMADFNLDGRLNVADIHWVAQHGLPACAADFNDDQAVNVQDIFAFLNAWFTGHPKADANGSNTIGVQDIFAFLNTWFQGC